MAGLIGFNSIQFLDNREANNLLFKICSKNSSQWGRSLIFICGDNNNPYGFFICLTEQHDRQILTGSACGTSIPDMYYDEQSIYIKLNQYSKISIILFGQANIKIEKTDVDIKTLKTLPVSILKATS